MHHQAIQARVHHLFLFLASVPSKRFKTFLFCSPSPDPFYVHKKYIFEHFGAHHICKPFVHRKVFVTLDLGPQLKKKSLQILSMDVEGGIHKYLVDSAWHLNLFLLSNINVTRAGAPHLTRLNTYQNNNIMDFSIVEKKIAK